MKYEMKLYIFIIIIVIERYKIYLFPLDSKVDKNSNNNKNSYSNEICLENYFIKLFIN